MLEEDEHHNHSTGNPIRRLKKSPCSSPKRRPKLSPEAVGGLLHSRIRQLEIEGLTEDEEDKQVARMVGKLVKEFSVLLQVEPQGKSAAQIKYGALVEERERLFRENARLRTRFQVAESERDSYKSEANRLSHLKTKLESLCRELSKENKAVKEQSALVAQQDQEKRHELSKKFEAAVVDVRAQMTKDQRQQLERAKETESLRDKFKEFVEQQELREENMDALIKAKDLESQLMAAKLSKANILLEQYANTVSALEGELNSSKAVETELRSEISIYSEKFGQVESGLVKSNELFLNFQSQMDMLTKGTKTLEKQNAVLSNKYSTANSNIITMIQQKNVMQAQMDALISSKSKLETLCRALQGQRLDLQKRLDELAPPEPLVKDSSEETTESPEKSPEIPQQEGQE